MAMQDSWRERIEHGKDLLSLGNPKDFSFSGDGGGGPPLWKASASSPTDNGCNGSDSSAVVSASDGASGKVTSESSEQGSTLKEHDYIGMAEVSSAALEKPPFENESSGELNPKETDLCLGLGLGLTPSKKVEGTEGPEKTIAFTFSQQEGMLKTMVDANISTRYTFLESAPAEKRSMQAAWTNASTRSITGDMPKASGRDFQNPQISVPVQEVGSTTSRVPNAFAGARVVARPSPLKNGVKRGYSEAMADAAKFNMTTEARVIAAMSVKSGDTEVKNLPKQPQTTFVPSWVPAKPNVATSWHVGLDQATAHPFGGNKVVNVTREPATDGAVATYKGNSDLAETGQDSATIEAPPPKDRVVGWPPIRSYRKNTLAKSMEMFVKVNMDGVTVGRKVDLNAHSSYDGLLSALEEMFQSSNSAQGGPQAASGSSGNNSKHFRLLNGSDYVLTYEDKDGDWMLVGDVPWSMFTTTVRRLRITRAPEASGPG